MQKNQANTNEEMLRSGNYWTLARKLCIPAILIMLVMVLYHMADVFFIGQTGDPNKVAAVSLASPMFSILSGLGVLLGNGECTAISLALGKGEYDRIKKISAFAVWGAILIGVVFAVAVVAGTVLSALCLIFRDQLLNAFLNDPDVLVIGRVCLLASIVIGPFYGFYQICTTYLQAAGKSKQAIIVSLLEKGIVYIPMLFVMNWLFHMYGIVFAATVTTVISAVAALIFCYKDYRKELKNVTDW
ncbi:MAG: hypothetical protein IJI53_10695 [Clostridia bacterium]|nr:hypothetical protein [Clostridia bacterium]